MTELFTLAQFNIRSLIPKLNDLKEHILSACYSVLCLTETWLSPAINDDVVRITGYNVLRRDRLGRGGGVSMYIKESVSFSVIDTDNNIEQLWIKIKMNKQQFAVGVVYLPHVSQYCEFLNSLEQSISLLLPHYDEVFCLGDFNIDVLDTNSSAFKKLDSILESFNLVQIVNSPTHFTRTAGTIIDLIITTNSDIINNVKVIPLDHFNSDHDLTCCELNLSSIKNPEMLKTIRVFKNFNYENFYTDLRSIPFEMMFDMRDVSDKLNFLNENLLSLFNFHAPLRTIKITKKPSPWITDNIRLLISLRDKARSRWRRTKSEAHHNYYKALKNYTTLACRKEKKAYFEYKLRLNGVNKIWKELNLLHNRKHENNIPDHLKNVDELNDYYINCIPKLPIDQNTIDYYNTNIKPNIETFEFKPVSEYDVQKILYSIKSNATGHDGLSIKLLLMCCPLILPFVTHIINVCLDECIFPNAWKQALVQPIPKKHIPEELKDLRPISVLPTLSKVLERVVDTQLRSHILNYNILPDVQSGFRPLHSCETALLNVTDDILRATDRKQVTILVLIDFSKAFDTLNHELLFAILKSIGMSNKVINFFRSYLENRTQKVKISNNLSVPLGISSGVPQGSILGPLLYTLYTLDFENVIKYCHAHFYADDTQLLLSFDPSEYAIAVDKVNQDISAVLEKSKSHSLNINANKTSVLVFGPQNTRSVIAGRLQVSVDGQLIKASESAKNLGLIFDTNLKFKLHINNCIRIAYMNLKMIYNNRHFLSQKVKIILCESLVLSRFNFCDTVYGPCINAEDARRIQVAQNSCLRLIFGIRRHQHISHKLTEIKWLNMAKRRLLHSACLYHKIIINKIPKYLSQKISYRTDVHNINVRFKGLLTPPLHRTELFKRSFTYQITKVYNSIPIDIKNKPLPQFKRRLKQHLFNIQNNIIQLR